MCVGGGGGFNRTFVKSITFGVDCSCVSYTLFCVDATEEVVVGLGVWEGALSSCTKCLFVSLICFYVGWVGLFRAFRVSLILGWVL